jgi:MFS family permease
VSDGVSTREVLSWRPVRLILGGEWLSSFSSMALTTTLGWQAYARTGDPLTLGLLGLAEFLPAVLLALPAGHIADRHDRRRVVALAQAGTALVALLLAADAALDSSEVWPLYALAAALGVATSFSSPAYTPLIAAAVPPHALAPAVAVSSTTWQTASIAGPALAGGLQLIGDPAPYLLCAVAAAGAALLVLLVPRSIGTDHQRDVEPPTLRDALDGIHLIRLSPALLGAISLDLVAVLFGGVTALVPVFATDILHVGAVGNGLLRAAPGAGALLMGITLTIRPVRRRVGPTLFAAVAVYGVLTIVFGLSTSFGLSLVALALLAASDMVSVYIRATLGPLFTPPALRGRVGAVERAFIGASNELGAFESGVVASLIGAVPTVVIGGVGSIVVAVVWAWRFPALRRVDRFEDIEPARLPAKKTPSEPG